MSRNSAFIEATTSVAFSIQLSKRQCNTLLRVAETFDQDTLKWSNRLESFYVVQVDSLKPLEARGLVHWKKDTDGTNNGFAGLTEAGRLMVGLLREAGLTIEATNTVGVLGRLQRLEAA